MYGQIHIEAWCGRLAHYIVLIPLAGPSGDCCAQCKENGSPGFLKENSVNLKKLLSADINQDLVQAIIGLP
jgi:hypothetical protein